MIRLIRKDGVEILLNEDMIESITLNPDTIITLTTGEKLGVKNNPRDITEKIAAYRIGIQESKDEQSDEAEEIKRE